MKQTITIDIDVRDGYELKYNPETRTIEEVKKEPVRSKSWDEFCKNHPNEYSFAESLNCPIDLAREVDALIQLTRLHNEWVGDWKPTNEKNYYAISYCLSCNALRIVQWFNTLRILSFPTKDIAEEFFECFKDLIEKAKKFI